MIEAFYEGPTGIRVGDTLHDFTQHTTPGGHKLNKTGMLPALCRILLDQGTDPDELITIYRGATPVFTPTRVGFWADKTVEEGETHSPRLRKFRPHHHAGKVESPDRRD